MPQNCVASCEQVTRHLFSLTEAPYAASQTIFKHASSKNCVGTWAFSLQLSVSSIKKSQAFAFFCPSIMDGIMKDLDSIL